jgi:hypothetical protein
VATALTASGGRVPARVASVQLGEPGPGGAVGPGDRVVGAEHEHPDRLLAVLGRRRQDGLQQRPAQPLGEQAADRRDQLGVGARELGPVRGAQQGERAPRGRIVGEGGAQLVAEAVQAPDLAMATAAIERAAGRLAERRRRPTRARQHAERVGVPSADLDLPHAGPRRGRQPVLDDLAGRQQRRRIHRQHAHAVERHRAPQHARGAQREVAHAAGPVHQARQLPAQALGCESRHASDCGTHGRSSSPGSWDCLAASDGAP